MADVIERFYVATTTGYAINIAGHVPRARNPGVTAMVLDRFHAHGVAAIFRSEDFSRGRVGLVGQRLALEHAEERARELNLRPS